LAVLTEDLVTLLGEDFRRALHQQSVLAEPVLVVAIPRHLSVSALLLLFMVLFTVTVVVVMVVVLRLLISDIDGQLPLSPRIERDLEVELWRKKTTIATVY
jgi:hypothetical protein